MSVSQFHTYSVSHWGYLTTSIQRLNSWAQSKTEFIPEVQETVESSWSEVGQEVEEVGQLEVDVVERAPASSAGGHQGDDGRDVAR